MHEIEQHQYDNGLALLVEPVDGVQSVGMTLLIPAGTAHEPTDQLGVAAALNEMLFRGAGQLDARAHSDALDQLGVQRSAEPGTLHVRLGARILGDRLDQALPLVLDMARRPQLGDEAFGPSVDLALQAIDSLDDEPQEKLMIELKRQHLPAPFGRSSLGRAEHLQKLTVDQVRAFYQRCFVPDGAIIAFAGCLRFEHVRDRVGELLGDWSGTIAEPTEQSPAPRGYHHEPSDSAQQHIGVAYESIPDPDPLSMTQRLAVAVLSGGMSGRLFTEVREKRGLCYAVYAGYQSMRQRGSVFAYAGTTPQRAAETLDVLTGELKRLSDGVDADEFARAVVGLKTRLVMQGESTAARAAALASDQYLRGRPRTLDDVAAEIDAVSLDSLNRFVAEHRPDEFTTLNVGPEPLSGHDGD